jgi:hypothetical protein
MDARRSTPLCVVYTVAGKSYRNARCMKESEQYPQRAFRVMAFNGHTLFLKQVVHSYSIRNCRYGIRERKTYMNQEDHPAGITFQNVVRFFAQRCP